MGGRLLAGLLSVCAMSMPAYAAHWTVDPAKSRLGFSVLWAGEPFAATFRNWTADIDFDPADLAHARVSAHVDLGSEQSDEPQFDDGLKGALGFQVSKFPQAQFEATHIVHRGGNRYVAYGTLSLHGFTRPVTLPFTLTLSDGRARMIGTAQVMRTDFAVGQGMWAAPKPVAHAVTVTIDLTATKSK